MPLYHNMYFTLGARRRHYAVLWTANSSNIKTKLEKDNKTGTCVSQNVNVLLTDPGLLRSAVLSSALSSRPLLMTCSSA